MYQIFNTSNDNYDAPFTEIVSSLFLISLYLTSNIFQMLIKFEPIPLLFWLRSLSRDNELILSTILPRNFLDQIFSLIPELKDVFSYILTKEDQIETENYIKKDISQLLTSNRSKDSIIVADLFNSKISHEGLIHAVNIGKEYAGD